MSPNCTKNRNHDIDTITIHCTADQMTVEALGKTFDPASRKASSNYGIGKDGKLPSVVTNDKMIPMLNLGN